MEIFFSLEKSIVEWFYYHRQPPLNYFFLTITYLGTGWVILPLLTFISFIKRRLPLLWTFLLSLIFLDLTIRCLKHLINRPRPVKLIPNFEVIGPLLKYGSFPSGHTALAFLTASFLSQIFPKYMWIFYFMAFLVGISRIYLGVHFPSDVICGGALGYLTGKGGWWIKKKMERKNEKRSN